jgi:hypothetical protein
MSSAAAAAAATNERRISGRRYCRRPLTPQSRSGLDGGRRPGAWDRP